MNPQPITIYLGGPIDSVSEEEAKKWREDMAIGCPETVLFYSPAHAYFNARKETAAAVDFMNKVAIVHADGVLVYLPFNSFGSIREIEFARAQSKPTAVVSQQVRLSLSSFDLLVHDSLGDALTDLMDKIVGRRNAPPTLMGIPMRPIQLGGNDEETDE